MKTKEQLQEDFARMKKKFENDPVTMIILTTMAVSAAAKLIDSISAAQGRRAYAKQVNHSVRLRRRGW